MIEKSFSGGEKEPPLFFFFLSFFFSHPGYPGRADRTEKRGAVPGLSFFPPPPSPPFHLFFPFLSKNWVGIEGKASCRKSISLLFFFLLWISSSLFGLRGRREGIRKRSGFLFPLFSHFAGGPGDGVQCAEVSSSPPFHSLPTTFFFLLFLFSCRPFPESGPDCSRSCGTPPFFSLFPACFFLFCKDLINELARISLSLSLPAFSFFLLLFFGGVILKRDVWRCFFFSFLLLIFFPFFHLIKERSSD